jgi:hypothetical protein
LGEGASLCWSVPENVKAETLAKALAAVPGVQSAQLDKNGLILLKFKDAPVVTLKQLDDAMQGAAREN